MRDWCEFVRQRLAELPLHPAEKEEVRAEIAAHLEDSHEVLITQGLSETEALEETESQVANWAELQRQIATEKNGGPTMHERLRQLWVPGFLSLTLSMLCVWALRTLGFNPRSVSWSAPGTILFHTPWLLCLPFFGALGAFISIRAGASRATALLASTFPTLALTLAFLLMFPIGMIVERVVGSDLDFKIVATILLRDAIGWLLLPLAALFVGGLLIQLFFSRKPSSPTAAIS